METPTRSHPLRAAALVAIICALGAPDGAAAQDKPPTLLELKQAAVRGDAQLKKTAAAMTALEKLSKMPPPTGLTLKQRAKWVEHTKWLQAQIARLKKFRDKHASAVNTLKSAISGSSSKGTSSGSSGQAGGGLTGAGMIQQNMQMNMEFLALQNQMQMESRQFNAVSNALKVRHDAAMAAVRNMK
jgi:hypothetical protein